MSEIMNFLKLNAKIFRNTQVYLDRILKKYELSSGTFRYLFILEMNEGISQNKLSRAVGNDKAMSSRTVMKLMESGYIRKEEDKKDARGCNLYLTDKAREIIPKLHEELEAFESLITIDLMESEKSIVVNSLYKVFQNTQKAIEKGVLEIGE